MTEITKRADIPMSAALDAIQGIPVLIIGDVMLDRYIFGTVDRISPEAPVPVVLSTQETHHLGGAGNVARNIKSLGGAPTLISVCGQDREAELLEETLEAEGIVHRLIADARPTTVKTRVIAQSQQVVRIDREAPHDNSPSCTQAVLDAVDSCCEAFSVILVSDYAKGLMTAELASGLREIAGANPGHIKLLADPKPRNVSFFRHFHLMTPNAVETARIADSESLETPEDIIAAGESILHKIGCDNLLVTLGGKGMALFFADGRVFHISAMAQSVYDVTGAGDTVIATTGLAIASGLDLLVSCLLANYAAGIVVGKIGAANVSTLEVSEAMQRWQAPKVTCWREGS